MTRRVRRPRPKRRPQSHRLSRRARVPERKECPAIFQTERALPAGEARRRDARPRLAPSAQPLKQLTSTRRQRRISVSPASTREEEIAKVERLASLPKRY